MCCFNNGFNLQIMTYKYTANGFLISAQVEIFVEVNYKISLDVRQYKKNIY